MTRYGRGHLCPGLLCTAGPKRGHSGQPHLFGASPKGVLLTIMPCDSGYHHLPVTPLSTASELSETGSFQGEEERPACGMVSTLTSLSHVTSASLPGVLRHMREHCERP